MKTKTQLLTRMKELGACSEATEYVTGHKSRSANKIGQDSPDPQWLVWFLVREELDLSSFSFACADRAVRVYALAALEKAGLKAEAYKLRALPEIVDRESTLAGEKAANAARAAAAYAAAYAASDASDAAAYAAYAAANAANAASDAAAERETQLAHLKLIWGQWARS